MRLTVYISKDRSITINAFDNDGYNAGALSTRNVTDAVTFIDSIRNKEPEFVQAKLVDSNGNEHKMPMVRSRIQLNHYITSYVNEVEVSHA